MKHKHYDLIVAWAAGETIESLVNGGTHWIVRSHPNWEENTIYRIQPKPPVVRYSLGWMNADVCWVDKQMPSHRIRATFDGETGELLSVEKI